MMRRGWGWVVVLLLVGAIVGVKMYGRGQERYRPATTPERKPLRVGYVCNFLSHEWYQNVTAAAAQAAREAGVVLKIVDSNLDVAHQVTLAENLLSEGVDVLVITPIDPGALGGVVRKARELGVPLFTESNVVEGAATYVGIDNFKAGAQGGRWVGADIREHLSGPARVLICGFPSFEDCRQRVAGFKAGLEESCEGYYEVVAEVDGGGLRDRSLRVCTDALTAHPEVNVLFGINDDSTLGGVAAYQAAGLPQERLCAFTFGLEGRSGKRAMVEGDCRAGLAMFPEYVGCSLVEVAQRIARGERLPEHYGTPTAVLTAESLPRFYRWENDRFEIIPQAVRALR
jgi:ABC-type sugar transport system substrate-binding protein